MALKPKLLMIGERYTCSSTDEWIDRLRLLYSYLPDYPTIALQIRAKGRPDLLFQAASLLPSHPRLIVNTALSDARDKGWNPIHLPESELSAASIDRVFGASIHSQESLDKGRNLGAQYLLYGPVFAPLSKDSHPVGLEALRKICAQSTVPILAVGGITPQKTVSVLQNGAYGVASAGWIMRSRSPKDEINRFVSILTRKSAD
ncbi:MAG: thiamine phosphate synthase [Myxococcota bacterium]|nr:thiamine phosphate synthase [Myxococcota bacterium]